MESPRILGATEGNTVAPRAVSPWKCEKILVVIDPSAEQHACLDKAMRLALRYRSSVELFICDTEAFIPDSSAASLTDFEYRRHLRVRRLHKLEGLAGPLRAAGLSVTTSADWNADLATGIGHHSIRNRADLIVKDTHHHIPAPRLAMSQTDATLIRQLPAALLLVYPTPWSSVPRVAAAIDPTQPAERSADIDEALVGAAASLSDALAGTLDVVHVLRNPAHLPDEPVTEAQRDQSHRQSRAQVSNVVQQYDPAAAVHFPNGPVAQSLLDFIAQNRPDILVMGVAARPHWINAFPGGTAAQLLDHLTCDLLVIKQPGFVSSLLTTD